MHMVRQGAHLSSQSRSRSCLDGQRLVIRWKQSRLRLSRPSNRSRQSGGVGTQTERATGPDSIDVGMTDAPLKVDWTSCALHLSSTLSWKNHSLFIGSVEATVCLFIPAEAPFYSAQSLCSLPLFPPYQWSSLPCMHNTSAAELSLSADTIRQCVLSKLLSMRTGAWVTRWRLLRTA
eukprot:3393912-Rhodomonas_salina.2